MDNLQAVLALEDGAIFHAIPFGAVAIQECRGEVVFATAMTGYQEICTDPSYRGQMVVLTYPLIGNYGISEEYVESRRPWLAALIVHEVCEEYSHWRATESISSYLARYDVLGIADVDTRALTRHLRIHGTKRGVIRVCETGTWPEAEELVQSAQQVEPISNLDLVGEVTVPDICFGLTSSPIDTSHQPRIIIIDTGVKYNIARCLAQHGLEVVLVPYTISLEDLLALHPDGIVLPNGPGDPESVQPLIELIKYLIPSGIPIMGICLGHQLIALAAGARTSRLPFGHHGANHPVKDVRTGRVTITSQNHNFQVDAASIPPSSGFHVSHINLLDHSVEGLYHEHHPVFSLQYHPEASPGPCDNRYFFDRFAEVVRSGTVVGAS
jgi:carbamoyl-phosphate synthase small subunit